MADVEPILFVPGEVRKVEKKRDYTDRTTGEVRVGKGRRVEVLTFGGFLTVSLGDAFDEVEVHEGDVILWRVKALPWTIQREERGLPPLQGTAYVYDGVVTDEELDALGAAGAVAKSAKATA